MAYFCLKKCKMNTEQVHTIRGTVYLAVYSHKHGEDYSVHATFKGAQNWFAEIVKEWRDQFITDRSDPWFGESIENLVESWDQVTGQLEFFNIHELELQK
jgi:hypothetical protein